MNINLQTACQTKAAKLECNPVSQLKLLNQTSGSNDFPQIVTQKMERLAGILSVDPQELLLWLDGIQPGHLSLDTQTMLRVIHLAITHRLDPLMGEVTLWIDGNQHAHPSITIDGWMKIMNLHPAFAGIEFEEGLSNLSSEEAKPLSAPPYMQCTIYRSDRQMPIRVREYLAEVKSDHPLWISMPRRMLRHRTLQQCARLAFGISTPEFANMESTAISHGLGSKVNDSEHVLRDSPQTSSQTPPKRETRTEHIKAKLYAGQSNLQKIEKE